MADKKDPTGLGKIGGPVHAYEQPGSPLPIVGEHDQVDPNHAKNAVPTINSTLIADNTPGPAQIDITYNDPDNWADYGGTKRIYIFRSNTDTEDASFDLVTKIVATEGQGTATFEDDDIPGAWTGRVYYRAKFTKGWNGHVTVLSDFSNITFKNV